MSARHGLEGNNRLWTLLVGFEPWIQHMHAIDLGLSFFQAPFFYKKLQKMLKFEQGDLKREDEMKNQFIKFEDN